MSDLPNPLVTAPETLQQPNTVGSALPTQFLPKLKNYASDPATTSLIQHELLPVIYQSFSYLDDADTQSHELRLNGQVGNVIYQVGGFYFKDSQSAWECKVAPL